MARRSAFILLGGFSVICRSPLYVRELERRDLAILLITPQRFRAAAQERRRDAGHPASALSEIAFVASSPVPGSSPTAAVIAQATRWRKRYDIAGVCAIGESLVEQAGLLADALGLRSPGLRASRVCRSKYLQRWYLPDWSPPAIAVPPGERRRTDLTGIRFPVIVKPAARHSSSGVRAVPDLASLHSCLEAYPDGEDLVIEERVPGQEYSVESLVQDGKVIFESVTEKRTNEHGGNAFVELGHTVPAPSSSVQSTLTDTSRAILGRLGFADGIAHAEIRICEDGNPVLMEIAARTPGDGLLALYQLSCGIPMEPAIVSIALGEPTGYPTPLRYARQVYLEHQRGVLHDVTVTWPGLDPWWVERHGMWPPMTPGAAGDPPSLRAVLALKDRGSPLSDITQSDDRVLTFFIDAACPHELDILEDRVRAAVRLESAPLNGGGH